MPPSNALRTDRLIAASPARIYAAFENPAQLARWWGPRGFTNTFETFEFRPGGRWIFVMHGPGGANYPNECVFRVLEPAARIVIEHVVAPWFELTVTLTPEGEGARLEWVQAFESPEVAQKLSAIVVNANEENLDRLEALLAA